jgi:hypothetical protein
MVTCDCHPNYAGNINRRIVIQDSPSIKLDPISKITNTKKAGGVVRVVDIFLATARPCVQTPAPPNVFCFE